MTADELAIHADVALWGLNGDEMMHTDIDSWAESYALDTLDFPNDTDPLDVEVEGWSAQALGLDVWSGETIAAEVADRFADECGFEELGDQYLMAARLPDVIAAFDVARALLVSKQTFLVAGCHIATAVVRFAPPAADALDCTYEILSITRTGAPK